MSGLISPSFEWSKPERTAVINRGVNALVMAARYLGGSGKPMGLSIGHSDLVVAVIDGPVAIGNPSISERRPDLMWQNSTTGDVSLWYMGGTLGDIFMGFSLINVNGAPGWSVVGNY